MTHSRKQKRQKNPMIYLVLVMAIFTISCGRITTASDEIIGVWKSSDTRYKDASFEIKKSSITFCTREGDYSSYQIKEIKREMIQDDEWVIYTILYLNRDLQKVEFPFYFRLSDSSVIRFVNQPNLVWEKENGIKS